MRFDLTVPFARFMAANAAKLPLPFKRYHMAKVWRGENTQRGRYREFMQCDFDIVGVDSAMADADIVLVIDAAMRSLGVGAFAIRINHRGIFNRFLARIGAGEKSQSALRIVDKIDKIGAGEVGRQLGAELGEKSAALILEFIRREDSALATLARMESMAGGIAADSERVRSVLSAVAASGAKARVVLDPSITRGLDYYTGMVFETTLDALPEIGSVCSGGRYDELASLYTARKLPGVGASVGLDRLMAALEALGTPALSERDSSVLVLNLDESLGGMYQRIASDLRALGLSVELYPEQRKLAQQFGYAEKKGIRFAIVLGREEMEKNVLGVKDLATRRITETADAEAAFALIAASARGAGS
jgi:histidyl-tRNA synthetase